MDSHLQQAGGRSSQRPICADRPAQSTRRSEEPDTLQAYDRRDRDIGVTYPMIRGYFASSGSVRRPFLHCDLRFPNNLGAESFGVEFLVDSGADRTFLSPMHAHHMGLDLNTLEAGQDSRGLGGRSSTRVVDSEVGTQGYSIPLTLVIPDVRQPIPSLLGRDFISQFALFMEESSNRVLFFDSSEVQSLRIPA